MMIRVPAFPPPAVPPFRLCFVCTGNICRSPMAEWVFRERIAEAGLDAVIEAGSAGTGNWHEGHDADPRTVRVLKDAGYRCEHTARQFQADEFDDWDLIVALDNGHARALRRMRPGAAGKIRLLREFDPAAGDDLDVPDPYYGDVADFAECLELVEAACPGLLDHVVRAADAR